MARSEAHVQYLFSPHYRQTVLVKWALACISRAEEQRRILERFGDLLSKPQFKAKPKLLERRIRETLLNHFSGIEQIRDRAIDDCHNIYFRLNLIAKRLKSSAAAGAVKQENEPIVVTVAKSETACSEEVNGGFSGGSQVEDSPATAAQQLEAALEMSGETTETVQMADVSQLIADKTNVNRLHWEDALSSGEWTAWEGSPQGVSKLIARETLDGVIQVISTVETRDPGGRRWALAEVWRQYLFFELLLKHHLDQLLETIPTRQCNSSAMRVEIRLAAARAEFTQFINALELRLVTFRNILDLLPKQSLVSSQWRMRKLSLKSLFCMCLMNLFCMFN